MSIFFFILVLLGFDMKIEPAHHDLHLSRCEVRYDSSTAALQITASIFIDDLEDAISRSTEEDLFILTDKEHDQAEDFIADYLQRHLNIVVDGEIQKAEYLGKEPGEDIFAAWFYLEVIDVRPEKSIEVTYDLLMEIFDDQRNIVQVYFDQTRREFFLFDHKRFTGILNL